MKTVEQTLAPFLDEQGRITKMPAKQAKIEQLMRYLAAKFEPGRIYSEPEINAICLEWHSFNDYFLIRRSLVDCHLLARTADGARYWLVE